MFSTVLEPFCRESRLFSTVRAPSWGKQVVFCSQSLFSGKTDCFPQSETFLRENKLFFTAAELCSHRELSAVSWLLWVRVKIWFVGLSPAVSPSHSKASFPMQGSNKFNRHVTFICCADTSQHMAMHPQVFMGRARLGDAELREAELPQEMGGVGPKMSFL